jgi:hypothetical protein
MINLPIYILGDSHCGGPFQTSKYIKKINDKYKTFKHYDNTVFNPPGDDNILWVGPITMYRFGRDKDIIDLLKFPLKFDGKIYYRCVPKESIIVFTSGDVDIRVHIKKQINKGRDKVEIIDTLVKNYIEFLIIQRNKGYKIVVYAVRPMLHYNPLYHNNVNFWQGTTNEHKEYRKLLNSKLENLCKINNFVFFNPHKFYEDEYGLLDRAKTTDEIHIINIPEFDTCFQETLENNLDLLDIN